MYTQCPGCRTIFEIDEDALQASLGIFRCGHCSKRFDALRTLSNSLPPKPGGGLPEHDPSEHAPTLTVAVSPDAAVETSEVKHESEVAASAPPEAYPPGDDTWLVSFPDQRAQALIADAAGIPADVLAGDPVWEITQLPIQIGFTDLGAAGAPAATTPPTVTVNPEETLASAALDEPWNVEFPDAGDVAGTGAVTEPASTGIPADDAPAMPPPQDSVDAGGAEDSNEADGFRSGQDEAAAPSNEVPADDDDMAASAEAVPSMPLYVPPRCRRIRSREGLWALGCLVLVAALAAQLAWAERVALVRDPATRAWAMHVCARMDCRLPPIRDPAQLELLSRDVRPDPDAAGALMITATLRNDARFRQPWPIVVVELTDLDNNVVAMRRFRPVEYMSDPARLAAGIAPGTTAAVAFEVADPGKRAVSFHFGFE
jgi:predicted Zn finger-like uncharacterized protein